jgi:imidazolonepropionase-like amidohydrolase
LGLLSRVGSLATGKDADLVILSGDVFEAGTRVLRTMIDGKFVDEARKP